MGPLDLKQRQHILLRYFKTLRVGPGGTGTRAYRLSLARVVQTLDSAICRINHHLVDKYLGN